MGAYSGGNTGDGGNCIIMGKHAGAGGGTIAAEHVS